MSSTTIEKILEEVKALTPDEQKELRKLIDEEVKASSKRDEKLALLRQIQNKYKDLPGGSEEFLLRKREDVELENRRFDERHSQ